MYSYQRRKHCPIFFHDTIYNDKKPGRFVDEGHPQGLLEERDHGWKLDQIPC